MEVTAKLSGTETGVTVNYDFPDTLEGLVDKFGSEIVYGKAMDSLVIDVQALVRRHLKGSEKVPPKSAEAIQEIVSEWVPGVGAVRKSPVEKVGALIASMTPEQKAALLASLRG